MPSLGRHASRDGAEYFARVADFGLLSLTHRDKGVEKQTAFTPTGCNTSSTTYSPHQAWRTESHMPPALILAGPGSRWSQGEISDHAVVVRDQQPVGRQAPTLSFAVYIATGDRPCSDSPRPQASHHGRSSRGRSGCIAAVGLPRRWEPRLQSMA